MSGAEETSPLPAEWAGIGEAVPGVAPPRRRLFRKYALIFIALVGAALLINSGFDFWFSYQENKAALVRVQQEKAEAAAQRIAEFVEEIKSQIGWTTHAQWAAGPLDQRRQDYVRLLRQVPAITELRQLDSEGKERLLSSRLAMDVSDSGADFSQSPAFIEAKAHKVWFSPVYFRKESEPYMSLAMALDGKNAGVTVADINLKLLFDVITALKIGQSGYAYVVDGRGRLIAHPDISLVLRDTDLSKLPQVAAALNPQPGEPAVMTANNLAGRSVLTAHAAIPQLGWRVFVEVPLTEAFAPLYGAALRSLVLLALGLIAAALVALVIARRMTVPIRALQAGAAEIGAGDLGRRIDIQTGDELEGLAQQFNRMAADLQKSYAELEQRVRDRTAELSDALERQTATAEVLGIISSSPGRLEPVFEAVLANAVRICGGRFGLLALREGDGFRGAAAYGVGADVFPLSRLHHPPPGTGLAALQSTKQTIQVADCATDPAYEPVRATSAAFAEMRTALHVAMVKEGELIGAIIIYRGEVLPFGDKEVELVENFAKQAVIAIENARLITETREALEQQTATAEVLGVINASPGDLMPVFNAMLERALRFCDAASGHLYTYDGGLFYPTVMRGDPEFSEWWHRHGPVKAVPGGGFLGHILLGEPVVSIADVKETAGYREVPDFKALVDRSGLRSGVGVALRNDAGLRGAITIYRQEVKPFTDKQIALLQNFAAQAVIAMENARLLGELRDRTDELAGREAALRASDERYAMVTEAAAEGIYDWNIDENRLWVSQRLIELFGWQDSGAAAGERPSQDWNARVHPEDFAGYRAALRAALKGETPRLFCEYRIRLSSGEYRWVEDHAVPVRDERGWAVRLVGAVSDVTERKEREQELRETLEQQTATAEVLSVINASPGDLTPVFDAMLEKARRLCDAGLGLLLIYEEGQFRTAALHGAPRAYAEFMTRQTIRPGPNTGLARLVRERRLVHISDLSADAAYHERDPLRVASVELAGMRTFLAVPLTKDDRTLGAFVIYRQEVRPFSDKQIALLQNFAAQAVIAMENARLITETREALEQQTATAEVLGVINSSPGDLAPVFDAMLEKAMRLCGAAFGELQTYDGERFTEAAMRGLPPRYAEFRTGRTHTYGPGTVPARLLAGERLIQVLNITLEDAYRAREPNRLALADLGGARTVLAVPLSKDDAVLGFIVVYRQEVRPFTDKQIALLQNFAAQAVIAMENARLITETREALEQQTATAEVLGVISGSTTDTQPVFEAIVASAARLCEAEFTAVARFDGEMLHLAATNNLSPKEAAAFHSLFPRVPGRHFVMGRAFVAGQAVQVEDVLVDPEYDERTREVLQSATGYRTFLAVPILREGVAIGVIGCARRHIKPFSARQIKLIETFADQAVIAIENVRLFDETHEALEQQTATAEVLGVINSSPGDLAPVFDAMLEKALRICEAAFGGMLIYDGERFHNTALRGAPPAFAEFLQNPLDPQGALAPIVAGEPLVQIADVTADAAYAAGVRARRAIADLGGARTAVWLALRKDQKLLGVIWFYRQEVRPFTDKQIALLQNFAAQAVIAMENARLITETREALEQQTATAEVLGVINSSPGDLAPVFDAILQKAHALGGASRGTLFLFDGTIFRAAASHGYPEGPPGRPQAIAVSDDPRLAALLAGEPLIHIPDLAQLDDRVARAVAGAGGVRTNLMLPLRKDGTLLGVLSCNRSEVRPFTDKQIALLQNFAAQAVIAMENARLITETREALEQQTATAEVLGVINASPGDLAPVFDSILEKAQSLCGAVFGLLFTFDGEHINTAALHNIPEGFAEFLRRGPVKPAPETTLARVIEERRPSQIADVMMEDPYRRGDPFAVTAVNAAGVRTVLSIPLVKDNAVLGVIGLFRQEVRPFSDKQIALLQNFAAQAVIAMENARLITETREALEQQTATAEVLGVINSSPGDLAPVFDTMLERALDLCEAAFGVLYTFDGESFHSVGHRGVSAGLADFLLEPITLRPDLTATAAGSLGRLMRGDSVVHDEDIADSEAYRAGYPLRRALVDLDGARTALWMALRKDNRLLGTFVIYRREVRPFSEKQIALLQNFAAQAVIAMENARLITETREALEQQTATAEVLGVINSSPGDLAPVFDAMLEKAMRLCDASFGSFAVVDADCLRAVAHRGMPRELIGRLNEPMPWPPLPGGHLERIARGEDIVPVPDFSDSGAYRSGLSWAVALVEKGGARTAVWAALRKDQQLLGVLVIYRQEVRPFSDKQIALLQNFAAQAVIAMENARLLTETRERTRDLQESLEYQTATADVLKVISQSTFDLEPVLQTVLDTAMRLCGNSQGEIFRLEDGVYRMAVGYGMEPAYREIEAQLAIRPGPDTLVGRTALARRPVQIVDALSDPDYLPRDDALVGKLRSMLGVPLMREGEPIGVICTARTTVKPFSEKEIELVRTFADQAVIAIENARLLNELRGRTRDLQESLEFQTATSDVLKVISRSTFDLDPVLENVIETAIRLCRAHMGSVFRLENGLYHWAVGYGLDPAYRDIEIAHPIAPGTGTLVGRVALERQAVQIPDAWTDPDYTVKDEARVTNARTMLGVPLLRAGVPIGVIAMARDRVEPFSDKEVVLVTTFADQAVIAIENARLLNELRERTDELARSVEELKALAEVGQAVSSTLDLGEVLSTVLNRSVGLTQADAGVIFRYSQARHAFRLVEAVGWDAGLAKQVRQMHIDQNMTLMGNAIAHRAPTQIADLRERPGNVLRDATLAAGYRSVLIVPLVGADRTFGVLLLQRRRTGEFPEATVRLMQTLAAQSVLAIQNARLFREIADKSEQLALASQHKSQFLANMSHELRTPLNAILGYAELLVDGIYGEVPEKAMAVLERVQNNGKHLLALINDVLDLSKIEAGQLTLTFEDYALPDVVQSVVTATEALASTKGLKMTAMVAPGLPMGHGDARRLSQVLLNLVGNAVKFTDAGEVAIGAMAEDGQFVLTVRDTGPGIAPEDHGKIFEEFQQVDSSNTRKKGGTGLGLAISKRMVEMQGGSIEVDSALGHGATFRVTLPIRVEHAADELTGELMGAA